ncbi:sigma-70 family RNA polymerase sigma factor [Herbidospora galbida]|uniref:Sigma-70 family RNA polymerase sigma factor n=1 Tax=Herbidospora galbida TaxID=2575442 RepID=A0A4U3MKU2_9ACTN|nr:sigma-70 family RNA polymerase sigma factor [Herbidospora galbida]TKK89369.1 sigma-70 family RNA polymerase sigma factor [Herbidospora galbida]
MIDAVWKLESAKIIGSLTRLVGDVGLAEEFAQDALVAAMERWPAEGTPGNPGAWLTAVARRRAIDHIRAERRHDQTHERMAHDLRHDDDTGEQDRDDTLRLMFLSCHPVLPPPARVALTLRLLGGMGNAEIARAFLTGEQVIARRVADAKRALAEHRVGFDLPVADEAAERLASVLEVVYLIFNEGYAAASGDDLMRPGLTLEALRLGGMLAEAAPQSEVLGLLALMEIQASRADARTGPSGEPIPLHEQDRGRWDRLRIRRGFTAMLRARELGGPPGPYLLQAAIAVCHAQAPTAEETDWAQIVSLYELLVRLTPTPVVRLNRAMAVGMARGPRAGLDLTEDLTADPALRNYHLLPAVRADLLLRLGRAEPARREFLRAAALADNAAERAFLARRAAGIPAGEPAGPLLGPAVAEFLAGRTDATARSYGQTLRRLRTALGEQTPLAELTPAETARAVTSAWGGAAPRTWNRHLAALRSFCAWAGRPDLGAELARRAEPAPAIRRGAPVHVWSGTGAAPRELALWWLLHESAAPVTRVLALNVEDLDLDDRRSRTGITWRSRTAALLPALIGDRTRGPLFLSGRRPAPARAPAEGDLCPHTGRRRLSYERAEHLFKQATGHTLSDLKSQD